MWKDLKPKRMLSPGLWPGLNQEERRRENLSMRIEPHTDFESAGLRMYDFQHPLEGIRESWQKASRLTSKTIHSSGT